MRIATAIISIGIVAVVTQATPLRGSPVNHFNEQVYTKRHINAKNISANSSSLKSTLAKRAVGDFSYMFIALDGSPTQVSLHDPTSPGCITLAEVADPGSSEPAFSPHNESDEWTMVYSEPDCSGDSWTLKPHGHSATDRLKLRSVFFTGRH